MKTLWLFVLFCIWRVSHASVTLSAGGDIQTAIDNVISQATDYTIFLNPGNYPGTGATLSLRGFTASPIRITGLGTKTSDVTVGPTTQSGSALFTLTTESLILTKVTVQNIGTGILTGGSSTATITINNCTFTTCSSQCLLIQNTVNTTISNSVFLSDFATNSIVMSASARGVLTVTGCDFYGAFSNTAIISSSANSPRISVSSSTFRNKAAAINANGVIIVTNNRFFSSGNGGNVISCLSVSTSFTASGNMFCGGPTAGSVNCGTTTTTFTLTNYDSCGICQGDNSRKDCLGVCDGTATGCAAPKDIYVYNGTTNGVGSRVSPYNDINFAVQQASYRDRVILLDGIYTISSPIKSWGKAITITSLFGFPDRTILNCFTGTADNIPGIYVNQSESFDTIFQGLTVVNCGMGAYVDSSSPTFTNMVFTNGSSFGNVRVSPTSSYLTPDVGGLLLQRETFVRIINSRISYNQGGNDGGVTLDSGTLTGGRNAILTFTNSQIISNSGTLRTGGMFISSNGQVIMSGSYFISNRGGSPSFIDALRISATVPSSIVNCSFYDNGRAATAGSTLTCGTATVTQSGNTFCGPTAGFNQVSCTSGWPTAPAGISFDSCGVCGGSNQTLDCSGTCFGRKVTDNGNGCCFQTDKDCAGSCSRTSSLDVNSQCCFTNLIDCRNICFGDFRVDRLSTCCKNTTIDCDNVCNGTRRRDRFNTCCYGNIDCSNLCNGTSRNDRLSTCCLSNLIDCDDICNGTKRNDRSNTCCEQSLIDCQNTCFGDFVFDRVNSCCKNTTLDCDRICNGTRRTDKFNTCCYGSIDCSLTCNGTSRFDNQSTCCDVDLIDCQNRCNGVARVDSLSQCCLPTQFDNCTNLCFTNTPIDCAGVCNGSKVRDLFGACCLPTDKDICGVCFGSGICPVTTLEQTTNEQTTSEMTTSIFTTDSNVVSGAIDTTGVSPSVTSSSKKKGSQNMILGIVLGIGGFFILVIVVLVIVLLVLKKKKSEKPQKPIEMQQVQQTEKKSKKSKKEKKDNESSSSVDYED